MPLPNDYMREAIRLTEKLLGQEILEDRLKGYASKETLNQICQSTQEIAYWIYQHQNERASLNGCLNEQQTLKEYIDFFELIQRYYSVSRLSHLETLLEIIGEKLQNMYELIGEYRPVKNPAQLKIPFAA